MKDKAKEIKEIEVIEAEPINVLETIKVSALIDVSSWKEKQLKLVAENTFFAITDNKTYEAGKKHRTNVVKGRTELQNQDKLVASKFASIRKEVGTETATLIEITQPLEDQWQEEVKAWEERKAREKKEADDAEALRVKTINDKIDETETSCYEIIQKMTFSEIDFAKTQLFAFFTVDFDFEEYDILFEQVKSRVELALENKIASLTVSENQRLDNIRLEEANAEAKRISDLQASRLNELLPYNPYGANVDMATLWALSDDEYSLIIEEKKALHNASVLANKKIEDERIAKEEEEKEAIYAIREKRLLGLGMQYSQEHDTFFIDEENEYILLKEDIRDYTALEFEETFEEVKTAFKEANDKIEKQKVFEIRKDRLAEIGINLVEDWFQNKTQDTLANYSLVFETDSLGFEKYIQEAKESISIGNELREKAKKQIEDDLKLAEEDAARLKAENKARIKKFAADKKTLTQFVKSLDVRNPVPELDNVESEETLSTFMIALEDFRKEWINNVEII